MSSTVSKQTQIALYIVFAILMMALGSSDSLRGVFAPIFEEHFTLSASDLSLIITVSYVGNLVFMLLGTRISDAFGLRMVFIATMLLWMAALALYLLTDNFILLLGGMFFAMGASTLLNIMLNLMSPFLFPLCRPRHDPQYPILYPRHWYYLYPERDQLLGGFHCRLEAG